MKSVLTARLLDDLYGWLAECAAVGRVCPGNAEIAKRYRFASVATAAKAVGRLEIDGRILVRRGWTARQAMIATTGDCTAAIRQADRTMRRQPRARPVAASLGPRIAGPRGRQCQWIEGAPGGDDSCKCLRWAVRGVSWCPAHLARIYLPPEAADTLFGPLPGSAKSGSAAR